MKTLSFPDMSGELSLQPFGLFFSGKMNKELLCIIFLGNCVFPCFPKGTHASNLSRQTGMMLLILPIHHPTGTGNGTLFLCPRKDNCQKARSLCCGLHLLPFSQVPQLTYLLCIFYSPSPLHALSPHSKLL